MFPRHSAWTLLRHASCTRLFSPTLTRPSRGLSPSAFASASPSSVPFIFTRQLQFNAPRRFARRPLPKSLQRGVDLLFYHPELLIGMAVGGMIATTGGVFYYLQQRGEIERLLAKTDRIKVERSTEGQGEGFSIPLPFLTFLGWGIFGLGAAILTRTKARMDLNFLQFGSRVNFSLNSMVNGELKFRTVLEKSLDSVLMGNLAANAMVRNAVKKVTEQDPFLRFPPSENFFMMTAILNEISQLTATGFFQADRHMNVERVKYILALTFEKNAPFKKLRVQIISEDLLSEIAKGEQEDPKLLFEEKTHGERWETIKQMAKIYHQQGINHHDSCLWRVEMAIPVVPGEPPSERRFSSWAGGSPEGPNAR